LPVKLKILHHKLKNKLPSKEYTIIGIIVSMLNALLAAVCIAIILAISEYSWKRIKIDDELARKFVHITAGVFIAFLPFWVTYEWIMVLAVGFIVVNFVNRYVNFFHAIHAVKRKSWGDVLFGVGVFIVAYFQPPAWIFAAAILQVSLADGFAAVAGVTYGKKHGKYYLFGQPKSVIGSVVFFLTSFIILTIVLSFDPYFASVLTIMPFIFMLSLMLVCIENLAIYGLDNVALPVATLISLSLL
jgi:dolichol kinase